MTRDHKLALIIGFALILAVGVLISDHLSRATRDRLDGEDLAPTEIAITPVDELRPPAPPVIGIDPEQGELSETEPPGTDPGETELAQSEPEQSGPVVIDQTPDPEPTLLERGAELAGRVSDLPVAAVPTHREPPRTHQVQPGESLYAIARRYYGDGNLWRDLVRHNAGRVGSNGELREHVTLIIPARDELASPVRVTIDPPAAQPTPSAPATASPETYTVAAGDTLGEISQKLLGTVRRTNEIVELNGLDDANDIRVGMVLKLPPR